jgi:hypothetical protein
VKRNFLKKGLLVLLFVCLTNWAEAGWFGPNNYEDCVLENMKGVTSNVAAVAIENACLKKFPLEKDQRLNCRSIPLGKGTSWPLSRIGVEDDFSTVRIFNPFDDVNIIQVELSRRCWIKKEFSADYNDAIQIKKTIDILIPTFNSSEGDFDNTCRSLSSLAKVINAKGCRIK